jgi:hypothetical protein
MISASVLSSSFMCAMMVQTRVHRVTRRQMAKSMPPLQLLLCWATNSVPSPQYEACFTMQMD